MESSREPRAAAQEDHKFAGERRRHQEDLPERRR